eukprot:m.735270 g.735270  ORF g.735270 m.735270 type:complete len:1834 (-) comp23088_c0_seq1:324-5825(-)
MMNVGDLEMLPPVDAGGSSVPQRHINLQSPLPRPADILARPAWQPCGSVYTWTACCTASPAQLSTSLEIQQKNVKKEGEPDLSHEASLTDNSLPVCEIALGRNITMLLTDPGEVFGIGYNDVGQMGSPLPNPTKVCTSVPVPVSIPGGLAVKKLACGWEHCAAITTTGALFMWGRGSNGQCGIGTCPAIVSTPQQVVIDPEETICVRRADSTSTVEGAFMDRVPSASDTTSTIASRDSRAHRRASSEGTHAHPRHPHAHGSHVAIVQVACGHTHTLAVTERGQSFSWGEGSQLGTGVGNILHTSPRRIVELDECWTMDIAAGHSHSLAIVCNRDLVHNTGAVWLASNDAQVWSWGENDAGQLGHGDTRARHTPQHINALQSLRVVNVAAGDDHSVVRTCLGHVYTWGSNAHNQLGRRSTHVKSPPKWGRTLGLTNAIAGKPSICTVPQRVTFFDDKGIVGIAASARSSVLLGSKGTGDLSMVYVLALAHADVAELNTPTNAAAADESAGVAATFDGDAKVGSINSTRADEQESTPLSSTRHTSPPLRSQSVLMRTNSFSQPASPSPQRQQSGRRGSRTSSSEAVPTPSSPVPTPGPPVPTALPHLEHLGFVRCVAGGGDTLGLIAHDKGVGAAIALLLRELASSEITFVNELREHLRFRLLPLLNAVRTNTGSFHTSEGGRVLLEDLVACYSEIWHLSCTAAARFATASNTGDYDTALAAFELIQPAALFEKFADSLCDAVAFGVFNDIPDTVSPKVAASKQASQTPDANPTVRQMLILPLHRADHYDTLLTRLGALLVNDPNAASRSRQIAARWDTLLQANVHCTALARSTEKFWMEHAAARKQFAIAPRRVLLHSKTCPLHSAKFLSGSPSYILAQDALLVSQVFSHREYPLNTLWVEDVLSDSSGGSSSGTSFRIISAHAATGTSTEVFTVYTDNVSDKNTWMKMLARGISAYVTAYDAAAMVARLSSSVNNRLSSINDTVYILNHDQLKTRIVYCRLLGHPSFKNALYEGEMTSGRITGHGYLLCEDGRVYKGSFRDGYCDGYCEMTAPPRAPGSNGLVKGTWRKGKLHGIALVHQHDHTTYCGSYVDGLREGHGVRVSVDEVKYTGSWKQGMRHGYGVSEDMVRGTRHLGMWHMDEKNGSGIVVSEKLYYEGDFSGDQLSGSGLLISHDDYMYEGHFASDCVLHGKGKLTMPNGDHIDGVFRGRWHDPTGIQVNGTYMQNSLQARPYSVDATLNDSLARGALTLTTQLRRPRVPMDVKWLPIFDMCHSDLTALSRPLVSLDGPSPSISCADQIVRRFKTPKDPLNKAWLSLNSALHVSYASATITHHRLLSDALIETKMLTQRFAKLLERVQPGLGNLVVQGCDTQPPPPYQAAYKRPLSLYQLILERVVLEDLFSVLRALYLKLFARQEGAYANSVATLNADSELVLLKRLGVRRKFWLLSSTAEKRMRERSGAANDNLYTSITSTPSSLITRERTTLELSFEALANTSGSHSPDTPGHLTVPRAHASGPSSDGSGAPDAGESSDVISSAVVTSAGGATSGHPWKEEHVLLNQQLSRATSPVLGREGTMKYDVTTTRDVTASQQIPVGRQGASVSASQRPPSAAGKGMLANISDGNAAIARGRTGSPHVSPLESPVTVQSDSDTPEFSDGFPQPRTSHLRPEPLRGNVAVHIQRSSESRNSPESSTPLYKHGGSSTEDALPLTPIKEHAEENAPRYQPAIAALRTLPLVSTPTGKVLILTDVFRKMTAAVTEFSNGEDCLSGMDDVLPVFLYVLARASVPHLRSELQYLYDFVDFDNVSGETEILLTTLRAGFFQLLRETNTGVVQD